MKMLIIYIVVLLICFLLPANAGSLFVGTKVIYSGGANQPPKEKDTGVSFNASARGNASEKSLNDKMDELFDNKDYETLLQVTETTDSKEARVYEAIALFKLNQKKAARKLVMVLLKDKTLLEEYHNKLCEELEIDGLEDMEEADGEN